MLHQIKIWQCIFCYLMTISFSFQQEIYTTIIFSTELQMPLQQWINWHVWLSSLCTVLIRRKKFTWIPVNVLYSTISFRFYINVNKSINRCKTEGEQVGYQLVLITSVYNIVKYEGECRASRNYLYYQENQNYYIMISDKEWVSFYQVEGRLKESIKTNVQQKTQRL